MDRPSNKVYFQVISTGYKDTAPSVLLFTDSQRYLFNCGEGTQRLLTECKVKLGRLDKLFFTRLNWSNTGGLPGMAMTLRDTGKSKLTLFGPAGFQKFLHSTRYFLKHEKVQFDIHEFETDQSCDGFVDNELCIKPIVIEGLHNFSTKVPLKDIPGASSSSSLHIRPQNIPPTVCYHGKLSSLPGKFLPKVAVSLGVPKGPKFGELTRGLCVTLEDGTMIKPEMVMETSLPGPEFCIVDCPSSASMKLLQQHKEINDILRRDELRLMIHLADEDIAFSTDYQQWLSTSSPKTFHWILSKDRLCHGPVPFRSRFAIQCKLHGMDPRCFPLIDTEMKKLSTDDKDQKEDERFAVNGDRFNLRPLPMFGLQHDIVTPSLDIVSAINEGRHLVAGLTHLPTNDMQPNVLQCTNRKRSHSLDANGSPEVSAGSLGASHVPETCSIIEQQQEEKKHPKIVFLGTGAAIPSKYRNVSSILLRISPSDSVLLDCGEGSCGQLMSHFGVHASDVLRSIRCIFISHMHADHHLGLIRILNRILEISDTPLQLPVVIAPSKMLHWLTEYGQVTEELLLSFLDCDTALEHAVPLPCQEGTIQIRTASVEHYGKSYGCAIESVGQWKITYSGDAMPSQALADIGRDSSLLIHEATFEDGMEQEAMDKRHSTMGQALAMATKMNATSTMLTHFSQRYPKFPAHSNSLGDNIGIAFDHLEIGLDDVKRVNRLLPKFQLLFTDEEDKTME